MAAGNLRRFSNPEKLREVRSDYLLELLYPYQGFFHSRGVVIPAPGTDQPRLDYAALVEAFFSHDIPMVLSESLYVIDELGTPKGMDALIAAGREQGIQLEAAQYSTPLDVAVRAYVHNREFVESIHHSNALFKKQQYTYFAALEPVRTDSVSKEQIEAMRVDLDEHYFSKNRGRHCRIHTIQKDGLTWFIIRHGDAFKRVVDIAREPNIVLTFRPASFTTMVLVTETGELGIHASSKLDLDLYRKLMGRHFFGFDEFFTGLGKYTLAPLVVRGPDCLQCADVGGIDWVKLVQVQYNRNTTVPSTETRSSRDLYDAFGQELIPSDAILNAAKFKIKFHGARSARHFNIMPPNTISHSRETDILTTEQWLRAREFSRHIMIQGEITSCKN